MRRNEEMKRKAMKPCTDEDMKINGDKMMKRRSFEDTDYERPEKK